MHISKKSSTFAPDLKTNIINNLKLKFMENVIELNGEHYVKVSSLTNNGLFTEIYYVYRKRKNENTYNKGIPFINKESAIKYMKTLENVLEMKCFIATETVYTRI